MVIHEHEWLGLCLITESSREDEWPYVAAVIYNRVRSTRYPDTYRDVILQPWQFSYFNPWTVPDKVWSRRKTGETMISDYAIWRQVAEGKRNPLLLVRACVWSDAFIYDLDGGRPFAGTDAAEYDITPDTLHYYSPRSMVPAGTRPRWARQAKRLYTPEGVDPERFVFAEGVP